MSGRIRYDPSRSAVNRRVVPFVASTASSDAPATGPPRLELAVPRTFAYGTATFAVTSDVPIVPSAARTVWLFACTVTAYVPAGIGDTVNEPSGRLVAVRAYGNSLSVKVRVAPGRTASPAWKAPFRSRSKKSVPLSECAGTCRSRVMIQSGMPSPSESEGTRIAWSSDTGSVAAARVRVPIRLVDRRPTDAVIVTLPKGTSAL